MQSIYSVAQINSYIKNMFTQDYMLQSVSVRGEVSNCKYHSSGHIYFTLKDKLSVIACVMFAGNRKGLSFPLKEGMQIVVSGAIDIYERDGKYQLYAKNIQLDGVGQLYERFENLKRELEERGMFAPEYKQPIPPYIRTLGVVTAETGAAVRDIINITKRRNPYVQIILYPAIVQGEQAAQSIVNGIHALEQAGVDVMIVGRGGGSLEDLWAFNEEVVAQAIFDCRVPIISAVGHETDTTISDFVADLRAPTPSAAAELAVYEVSLLEERIGAYQEELFQKMRGKIQYIQSILERYALQLTHVSPTSRIRETRFEAMQQEERMRSAMERILLIQRKNLALYIERLKGLSPLEKLNQGFSFTEDMNGNNVSDIHKVQKGDKLQIYLKNGRIMATVDKTEIIDR
ncbi:MAG: exodeoxyribonuclease VII large subunit [Lachnospiraceae bacterium]